MGSPLPPSWARETEIPANCHARAGNNPMPGRSRSSSKIDFRFRDAIIPPLT